jgi:hypothetical protein
VSALDFVGPLWEIAAAIVLFSGFRSAYKQIRGTR